VHIADQRGSTLMLLPLGISRRHGLSILHFLGDPVTDYHAPLVHPELAAKLNAGALNRLIAFVVAQLPPVDVIAFEKMPLVTNGVTNPLARLPGARHMHNAYAATLGETFVEFKKRRSAKFFSSSARKWRRLSEIAPAKLCIAKSPDAAADILRALVRQKKRFYREVGAPNLFAKPHCLAFYATMAARHMVTRLIQTSALYAGGTIVATHWGMVFRNRFYWLMPTYEAGDWARFSPDRLLMQSLMEWSISQGLNEFDLTIGDETYKSLWADHTLHLYDCIRGLTLKGTVYRMIRAAGGQIKDWAKRSAWPRTLVSAWRRLRHSHS
jgi:CelD/BcsL family acetyltransferase involved in cellulose biosynthesis